jgi:hypothetical protein
LVSTEMLLRDEQWFVLCAVPAGKLRADAGWHCDVMEVRMGFELSH